MMEKIITKEGKQYSKNGRHGKNRENIAKKEKLNTWIYADDFMLLHASIWILRLAIPIISGVTS